MSVSERLAWSASVGGPSRRRGVPGRRPDQVIQEVARIQLRRGRQLGGRAQRAGGDGAFSLFRQRMLGAELAAQGLGLAFEVGRGAQHPVQFRVLFADRAQQVIRKGGRRRESSWWRSPLVAAGSSRYW